MLWEPGNSWATSLAQSLQVAFLPEAPLVVLDKLHGFAIRETLLAPLDELRSDQLVVSLTLRRSNGIQTFDRGQTPRKSSVWGNSQGIAPACEPRAACRNGAHSDAQEATLWACQRRESQQDRSSVWGNTQSPAKARLPVHLEPERF